MATKENDPILQADDRVSFQDPQSVQPKPFNDAEPSEINPYLIKTVTDWQYMHGSLLKIPPDTGRVLARPIGVAVFPTPFPKACFDEARELQRIYNLLYVRLSEDEQWLRKATLRY